VLAEADYVVATIHYGINQTEKELTRLLVARRSTRGWTRLDTDGAPRGQARAYAFDSRRCVVPARNGLPARAERPPERMDLPDTLAAAGKQHGVRFRALDGMPPAGELPFMKYAGVSRETRWTRSR